MIISQAEAWMFSSAGLENILIQILKSALKVFEILVWNLKFKNLKEIRFLNFRNYFPITQPKLKFAIGVNSVLNWSMFTPAPIFKSILNFPL